MSEEKIEKKITKIAARSAIKSLDLKLEECAKKYWDSKITQEDLDKLKRLGNLLLDERIELMKIRDGKK